MGGATQGHRVLDVAEVEVVVTAGTVVTGLFFIILFTRYEFLTVMCRLPLMLHCVNYHDK